MIPNKDGWLVPPFSRRHQPIQMFLPLYLNWHPDERMAGIVERAGDEIIDIQSLQRDQLRSSHF